MEERLADVPVFSTLMTAPATTAPDESCTAPTTDPKVDWAKRGGEEPATARRAAHQKAKLVDIAR
jgi:septal ring-binding cell division protein DamX